MDDLDARRMGPLGWAYATCCAGFAMGAEGPVATVLRRQRRLAAPRGGRGVGARACRETEPRRGSRQSRSSRAVSACL